MRIRTAEISDLPSLCAFYDAVIDHQPFDEFGAGWTKNVYPDLSLLEEKIRNDLFFLGEEEEKIVCAAALSLHEEEMYRKGRWTKKLNDDQIGVLHLFAVHPEHRGKGMSQRFLAEILAEASKHVRCIHLDVMKGNLPALKTYEKAGFRLVDEIEAYYADTGNVAVWLMEHDL